jgi:hypothetical protein
VLTTAVAGVPAASGAIGATAAGSTAPAPPQVTSVSVSPAALALTGLETAPVTVSVSLAGNVYGDPTSVYLQRTTTRWDRSAPSVLRGALHRTSGTATAGTHQAVISVPSTAHGPWRVTAFEFGLNGLVVDPRDSSLPDATLDVTGTHRPRMRFGMSPRPLPYPRHDLRVTARVTYDDTRAPIAGRWVSFGADSLCTDEYLPPVNIRTNAQGYAVWRVTIPGPELLCAEMFLPAAPRGDYTGWYAAAGSFPVIGATLSAAPSKSAVHRHTKTAVNGRVLAIDTGRTQDARVVLQRLVGRHWRSVSDGKVRSNGRFTLYASPPKGRNSYRVTLPAQGALAASTTKAFVLRGT